MIVTERLEILPATPELTRAALQGPRALAEGLNATVPPTWPPEYLDAASLEFTLDRLAAGAGQAGWWLYFFVRKGAPGDRMLIGNGGYKGPPSADGAVEVGYGIVSDQRRRGYASEAVRGLLAHAFASPGVRRVIAETLPELTASIGVLRKCGFRFIGEGSAPGIVCFERTLRDEILAMSADDERVREELAADGSLFAIGYHPRMEAVHRRHAERLRAIVAAHGWPGESLVGRDGAEGAWLVVQHAIGEPALQRAALTWLQEAAGRGEAPAWQAAMLEDRIRVFEGRPQIFGTQFDLDDAGLPAPLPIEAPQEVDERRRRVGLESLAEAIRRRRGGPQEPVRGDRALRQREFEDWARAAGWRR